MVQIPEARFVVQKLDPRQASNRKI
uniref:Uncharacterized protein n=1 Tax=Rhizophora mucronata TaxID=61149 RepID=A0A2P2JID5_RHIMU